MSYYTEAVEDGSMKDLRSFVLQCASARTGTEKDAPLPEKYEPDTAFIDESLEKLSARLAELQAMTPVQWAEESIKDFNTQTVAWEKRCDERRIALGRLNAMTAKVMAWNPPDATKPLRKLMLEWLEKSAGYHLAGYHPRPVTAGSSEWFKRTTESLLWSINVFNRKRIEHLVEIEEKNLWLNTLRVALAELES